MRTHYRPYKIIVYLLAIALLISMLPTHLLCASAASQPFELPIEGTTGYAVRDINIRATPSSSGKLLKTLAPGTPYIIIGGEEGNYLKVRLQDGTEGYASKTYTMVNLPDIIPSIQYNATNSYNSLYRSLGYELPGITGQSLYIGKIQNNRLGYSEYMMPVIYGMAKKIMAAQQAALADGNCLILYEAFRPKDVQKKVAASLNQLANNQSEVDKAVRKNPNFSMTYFINTSTSNHQLGVAIDVSLGSYSSTEDIIIGTTTIKKPSNVLEYNMPSTMHELSPRSAVFTSSGSQTFTNSFKTNYAANLLRKYCTNAGLSPLSSEWWHFNDNAARAQVIGTAKGEFFITTCLSLAPDGSITTNKNNRLTITLSNKATDTPLPGGKFRVTRESDKTVVFDGYTNFDGTAVVKDLKPGWYIVQQVYAPSGFALTETQKKTEIINGQSSSVNFVNETGAMIIQIRNINSTNSQTLGGAKFQVIRNSDKTVIGEYISNYNGLIQLVGLLPGFYTVYRSIDSNENHVTYMYQTVYVDSEKPTNVIFENINGLKLYANIAE